LPLTRDYVDRKARVISNRKYSQKRFKYVLSRFRSSGKRLLVIGFGHPFELECSSHEGFEVIGLDRDWSALSSASKQHFMVVATDASVGLPFHSDSFDLVLCHHVIEHIADPDGFVREVCRVLDDDGVFVVETPDLRFNKIFWGEPTHITPFTKDELIRLVSKYFEIQMSQLFIPMVGIWRYSNLGFIVPNLLNLKKASVLVIGRKLVKETLRKP